MNSGGLSQPFAEQRCKIVNAVKLLGGVPDVAPGISGVKVPAEQVTAAPTESGPI